MEAILNDPLLAAGLIIALAAVILVVGLLVQALANRKGKGTGAGSPREAGEVSGFTDGNGRTSESIAQSIDDVVVLIRKKGLITKKHASTLAPLVARIESAEERIERADERARHLLGTPHPPA